MPESHSIPEPEMTLPDLVLLLEDLKAASLKVWLDGGWGVDALLETQTRLHRDVDLVLRVSDVANLRELLCGKGYQLKEGSPPDSFVLGDDQGLEVDVHAVRFDDKGNGIYRMQNGEDWIYPAKGFAGRGSIGQTEVKCLSPSAQVFCHAHGYMPAENDIRDMELLHARFGVELPPQLTRTQADESS